jgi:lysophospholipase L1-like esterase
MQTIKTRLLFPLVSICITLLFIEIVLHIISFAAPKQYDALLGISRVPIFVKDSRLVLRPNPDFPEHYARGFRNESRSGPISIVALGDSQTYGTDIKREEAWPQQLGQMTDSNVYNMACGGWGPTQSLQLFDDAISLKPKIIIEAFYSGNDLYDSFSNVYYDGQLIDLKTRDEHESSRVLEAEKHETLRARVMRLYEQGGATSAFAPPPPQVQQPLSSSDRFRKFLGDHVRIYQLLALLKRGLQTKSSEHDWESEKAAARAEKDKDYYYIFEAAKLQTIFTPKLRLVALDQTDPTISEGLRISLEAIKQMRLKAHAVGIDFQVMLIPTKELVFKQAMQASTSAKDITYDKLLENEEQFRQKTITFLNNEGIKIIDVLPTLEDRVKSGPQPYPATSNGHPSGAGQTAIAECALKTLKSQNAVLK